MTRSQRLILAAIALVVGVGLIPVVAPALMQGALAIPTLMVVAVLTIIILLSVLSTAPEAAEPEKRKRSPRQEDEDLDLAQLVDHRDGVERNELKRLLDETASESILDDHQRRSSLHQ